MARGTKDISVIKNRVVIGIFYKSGLDITNLSVLGERLKKSCEKVAPAYNFNVITNENPEDNDPKLKVEDTEKGIYLWINDDIVFISSGTQVGEASTEHILKVIKKIINVDVFKNITSSSLRFAFTSQYCFDDSNKPKKVSFLNKLSPLFVENDEMKDISIESAVDIDDRHEVQYSVSVVLDNDGVLADRIDTNITHTFRYPADMSGSDQELMTDINSVNVLSEIKDATERVRRAVTL